MLKLLPIAFVLFFGSFAALFFWKFPSVENANPAFKVVSTFETIERGRYLANHVSACITCHSKREWSLVGGPVIPGTDGQGGEGFLRISGFPGDIYAPNLTPSHLSSWSDSEIKRAFTQGVDFHKRSLFPIMPYPYFSKLSSDDADSIVAYLRTLKPIVNVVKGRDLDFPLNILVRTFPGGATPSAKLSRKDGIKYGDYLANAATCKQCHSPSDGNQLSADVEFSGGVEFKSNSDAVVRSTNITSNQEHGIGKWTREQFIDRFKSFTAKPVSADHPYTPMPWAAYQGMDPEDLGLIFDYLMSIK